MKRRSDSEPLREALEFALALTPEAWKARRLVREGVAAVAARPDVLDRQLDELDRTQREMRRILADIRQDLGLPSVSPVVRDPTLLADLDRRIAESGLAARVRELEAQARGHSGLVSVLRPLVASGSFIGDLARVTDPRLVVPADDWEAALERLACRIPCPIHRLRWPPVLAALHRYARKAPARRRLLHDTVKCAVRLAAWPVYVAPLSLWDKVRALRIAVSNLVTDTLCEAQPQEDPADAQPQQDPADAQPRVLSLDAMDDPDDRSWSAADRHQVVEQFAGGDALALVVAKDQLDVLGACATPRERELLAFWQHDPGSTYAELAARFTPPLADGTVKAMVSDLRKRARAAGLVT